MEELSWQDPLLLERNEIHVWWARVDRGRASAPELLSDGEIERARRFHFDRDRNAFLARRGLLRRLLGGYSTQDGALLTFAEGPQGKPFLTDRDDPDNAQGKGSITFNLSHSEDRVLIGIGSGIELGVDVQAHDPLGDGKAHLDGVAERVFTLEECVELDRYGDAGRREAFYRGWARKEAALKALGEGFSREPRELFVGLEERSSDAPWSPRGETVLADFTLVDLDAAPGFSAALCAWGSGWTVRVFHAPQM